MYCGERFLKLLEPRQFSSPPSFQHSNDARDSNEQCDQNDKGIGFHYSSNGWLRFRKQVFESRIFMVGEYQVDRPS